MSSKAGFQITIKGEVNEYSIFSIFVLPNEVVFLTATQNLDPQNTTITFLKISDGSWSFAAPNQPGTYLFDLEDGTSNSMRINVLVLTPISEKEGEYMLGYRIGNYPIKPLNGNPIYERPKGLFAVDKESANLMLTPHFSLMQFLCKQQSNYPKLVLINERLLLKLEYLLSVVNEAGYPVESFGFISAYRTPDYNKQIKNVRYSRHVYGGAVDIIIDQDKDGHMDDLNQDGITNASDVEILHALVEAQYHQPAYRPYRGGLGFYEGNGVHKGFIHVDVRGNKARWGH
jgi:uncharacterized protein YcbK (DUF882 family)